MFLPKTSPATMPRTASEKVAGEFSEGGRALSYDRWKATNPDDETLGSALQLSDAVLAHILNPDDALGLAYRLSPYYANATEVGQLAAWIWRWAQERHQLDKDERS
jgi:hypothetical protein